MVCLPKRKAKDSRISRAFDRNALLKGRDCWLL